MRREERPLIIRCDKTYKVLEALIDCNIGIQRFYDYLADIEFEFAFAFTYKNINNFVKQIDTFKSLILESLQEKHHCNDNAEYHQNQLYGFAGLKCRNYQLDKARVNYLCNKVFMDLAKESNIDYIIFKQEN